MASKAVAPVEVPEVPALVPTPATTIDAADIVIPRLYVGNQMSKAVKRKRASFGDIYIASGADDPDAQVLYEFGSSQAGVLAHVLHLRKGKSWTAGGSAPLQIWDFDDPNAHPDAWTTYTYTLFLPEVDPDMPVRMLLTKSGRGTAQRINTVLARNAAQGPYWLNAFRITSDERSKDDNEWAVFQVAQVQADPKHVTQAGELFALIAPGLEQQARRQSTPVDEPEI